MTKLQQQRKKDVAETHFSNLWGEKSVIITNVYCRYTIIVTKVQVI